MTLFGRTTRPDGEREEGGEGGDERSQESENKRKEQLEKTTRKNNSKNTTCDAPYIGSLTFPGLNAIEIIVLINAGGL